MSSHPFSWYGFVVWFCGMVLWYGFVVWFRIGGVVEENGGFQEEDFG